MTRFLPRRLPDGGLDLGGDPDDPDDPDDPYAWDELDDLMAELGASSEEAAAVEDVLEQVEREGYQMSNETAGDYLEAGRAVEAAAELRQMARNAAARGNPRLAATLGAAAARGTRALDLSNGDYGGTVELADGDDDDPGYGYGYGYDGGYDDDGDDAASYLAGLRAAGVHELERPAAVARYLSDNSPGVDPLDAIPQMQGVQLNTPGASYSDIMGSADDGASVRRYNEQLRAHINAPVSADGSTIRDHALASAGLSDGPAKQALYGTPGESGSPINAFTDVASWRRKLGLGDGEDTSPEGRWLRGVEAQNRQLQHRIANPRGAPSTGQHGLEGRTPRPVPGTEVDFDDPLSAPVNGSQQLRTVRPARQYW